MYEKKLIIFFRSTSYKLPLSMMNCIISSSKNNIMIYCCGSRFTAITHSSCDFQVFHMLFIYFPFGVLIYIVDFVFSVFRFSNPPPSLKSVCLTKS